MERNITELIKEHKWLLPVLVELANTICASSAEMDDPEDLAQVHLRDFIKANTPTPLLSKMIAEKSYETDRGEEVISMADLDSLLELVAKGDIINDIQPPKPKAKK